MADDSSRQDTVEENIAEAEAENPNSFQEIVKAILKDIDISLAMLVDK